MESASCNSQFVIYVSYTLLTGSRRSGLCCMCVCLPLSISVSVSSRSQSKASCTLNITNCPAFPYMSGTFRDVFGEDDDQASLSQVRVCVCESAAAHCLLEPSTAVILAFLSLISFLPPCRPSASLVSPSTCLSARPSAARHTAPSTPTPTVSSPPPPVSLLLLCFLRLLLPCCLAV